MVNRTEAFTRPAAVYPADRAPGFFAPERRQWQGCPAVEVTDSGRIYAAWYSGGPREPHIENYCILAYSDNGINFRELYYIMQPEGDGGRVLDIQLWRSPDGVMRVFWTATACLAVSSGDIISDFFDRRFGVWCAVLADPDSSTPVLEDHKRLCDGFMRCRPTVLRDGRWAICAYDWMSERYAYYTTADGISFERRNGAVKPDGEERQFDETMIYECLDGTLCIYSRLRGGIGLSESGDGIHWSPVKLIIPNPSARFFIRRLKSGRTLFVHSDSPTRREKMTAFLSEDDGLTFQYKMLIDGRDGVSYPDAVEKPDGAILLIHDYARVGTGEILLTAFTEEDIINGAAPATRVISKIIK